MKRFSSSSQQPIQAAGTLALMFIGVALQTATAAESLPEPTRSNSAKNLARMNCGAQIECFTPDGREGAVATANEQNQSAAALIMDDDTLSCPLKEGQTTFIITLPTTSLVDRFGSESAEDEAREAGSRIRRKDESGHCWRRRFRRLSRSSCR